MKQKHFVAAMIAAVALLVPGVASSTAVAAVPDHSVAVRSFPAQRAAQKADVLAEAVSLTASRNSHWGGVESLSVPKDKTPQEKRQEAARRHQRAQQPRLQQEAASRSEQREPVAAPAASSSARSSVPTFDDKPASKTAAGLAQFAQRFTSVPYVWGGTTPAGWDCSGFTQWIFGHFGVHLPRLAADQRAYAQAHGHRHSVPQVGDLMAMNDGSHMAIYLGNGMMMHAPLPGMLTQIIPVYSPNFEYYGML